MSAELFTLIGTQGAPGTPSIPNAGQTVAKAPSAPSAPPPLALFLIVEPVDMRLSIDGLSTIVQTRLSSSACGGGLYLFTNTRRNRLKLLMWDGTGVWLSQRRLHQGCFSWVDMSQHKSASLSIGLEAWGYLMRGVDWTVLYRDPKHHAHWRVG